MAITNTPRFGFKKYSSGQDKHPDRDEYNAHIALLEENAAIQSQGPTASRPKAGKQGRLFKDTTSGRYYWDDGTSWHEVGTNGGAGAGSDIVPGAVAVEGTSDRSARADHTHLLPLATASADGALSKADKSKLDGAVASATANRLVLRDASGRISVGAPTASDHATTKTYVDSAVTAAKTHATDSVNAIPLATNSVDGLMRMADKAKLDAAHESNTPHTLPMRNATGQIMVGTPTTGAHATRKDYVDAEVGKKANTSHTHNASDIDSGTLAVARLPAATQSAAGILSAADKTKLDRADASNTAGTLVMRNGSGNFSISEPAAATHPATKGYVDGLVNVRLEFHGDLGTGSLNAVTTRGIYWNASGGPVTVANGYPLEGAAGTLVIMPFAGTNAWVTQEWTQWSDKRRWLRSTNNTGSTWTPWVEQATTAPATASANGLMLAEDKQLLDTATASNVVNSLVQRNSGGDTALRRLNLVDAPSSADHATRKDYVDAQIRTRAAAAHTHDLADLGMTMLGQTQNLDEITVPNFYHQNGNAYASLALNYPVALAGMLEVQVAGGFIYQRYTTYASGNTVHTRSRYTGNWSTWKESSSVGHSHAGGDITSGTIHPDRIANATASLDGLMSKADKAILDRATHLPTGGTLVERASSGAIHVVTGTAAADAANKGYVDGQIATRAAASHSHTAADVPNATTTGDGLMSSEDKVKLNNATSGATGGTLVMRASNGQFSLPTPTSDTHAANKSYVDEQVATRAAASHNHSGANITTGTISPLRIANATQSLDGLMSSEDKTKLDKANPSAYANTLVIRNADGVIAVGEPTGSAHATTKAYVDGKTNPLIAEAVDHYTSTLRIAGAATKPSGVPWKHFAGAVLVETGAGGATRTAANATDTNGIGGLWFGYDDLPKFSGIAGIQLTTKSSDVGYTSTIAVMDVTTTRIKFRAAHMVQSTGSTVAWNWGNILVYLDIWGW